MPISNTDTGVADISIVGAGLAGTLTAIQLIQQAQQPLLLRIFDASGEWGPGLAYQGRQAAHLLNVAAAKMSLDPKVPDDFVDWLLAEHCYPQVERAVLAQAFVPRRLFGLYVKTRWQQALQLAQHKGIALELVPARVTAIVPGLTQSALYCFERGALHYLTRALVLASGNELPRHPAALPAELLASDAYVQNPWSDHYLTRLTPQSRVLILGNGLTMVDTLLSLREAGLKSKVISLSPHGYHMLPHRHPGLQLAAFSSALPERASLRQLLALFNRARHQIRALGISAEPLVDALRPHTQRYWQQFSDKEQALFMRRLRHLWGVARHRVPLHLHDQLQQQRLHGVLEVTAGRLSKAELCQSPAGHRHIRVGYWSRHSQQYHELEVDMLINCTGPEQDFRNLPAHPWGSAIAAGQLAAGPLGLGLSAEGASYRLKNAAGEVWPAVYGVGSLLRGELWESTALQEIRQQAVRIAAQLLA